ncbi:pyruvate kinase [Haloplasma contractile]|uniref:Pyruvate kinase n=1 Tax=Haloplasma contractile SSD-17B TaxID=1033810 RepID=F7PWI9_9MOLU|nr:pyruvate kinase [Haloplasma contractile]ERJ10973.1 Pyruvate kinase protein [Haloplasma contractile SSD-17B]
MEKNFKQVKMICTLGPASESKEIMSQLVDAGMNVTRFNFSHGDHAEQGGRMQTIREINEEKGTNVALLLDTKGPEIRTHLFEGKKVTVEDGSTVKVHMSEITGSATEFSVSYPGLIDDVEVGGTILVDDGYLELKVIEKQDGVIVTKAMNTHMIKDRRGINVPNAKLNMPFISEKDRADIIFGAEQKVDFIAASFVRRADDVLAIREILKEHGGENIQIIAKIENQEGVANAEEILEVADGIMVARGDLGVEVPAEEVPVIQKRLIRQCNEAGKIVVTATQMLESMQDNPRPTRAEVSDVANAVYDGTDAIMLSGESAAGTYPVRSVQMMADIARRIQSEIDHEEMVNRAIFSSPHTVGSAIGISVADSAYDLGAKTIVAATISGKTARELSKYRPVAPIIAATPKPETARALALNWGVHPVVVKETATTDELIQVAKEVADKEVGLESGDVAIITAGLPVGEGKTNLMKIHVK